MICINVKTGDDYPGVWVGELPGEAAAGAVSQGGGVVVQQQLRAAGRHRGQREVLGGYNFEISAANRLVGEVVKSRRRPILGPSPG